MKFLLPVLFMFVASANINAQFTLKIVLNDVATKKQEDVYVAGSFNNWNSRDEKYKLKPFGTTRRALVLKDVPAGTYEFKFTRGTNKWESSAKGDDIPNREIKVTDDATYEAKVEGWKDDFPEKPRLNTATAQVSVIDTAFTIPQLNRKRRIWSYIPKGYLTSKKSYPVIYMHDGQNLFNEQTAPYGEWGVDEALDSLMNKTGKEAIIIGIDHGNDKRMSEYNPYDHKQFGKGEGSAYVDFIVNTLKPFIDKKYRTLKDSSNTYIAGSSMGGLISIYAVAKYPNIFGGAGVFSPAFWTAPSIYEEVAKSSWGTLHKFFFYAGGKEGDLMVPDMDKMIKLVEKKGKISTLRIYDPLGKHNEPKWRVEFPQFYSFIMK